MKKIRALFKYARPYKMRYIWGIFCLILVDFLQLIPPKILGDVTDSLMYGNGSNMLLLKSIGIILVITVLIAFGRFVWRIYVNGSSRKIEYDIRSSYVKHLQSLSSDFYDERKTGDLMALATNDLNAVRMAVGPGVIMFFDSVVLTFATLFIMLSINVKLTVLALIPLPFIAIVSTKFGKMLHSKFGRVQRCFGRLTDVVQENFSGIRIVKSFVQEKKEYDKFLKENDNNFDANMDFVKIWGVFSPLVEFISLLSFAILIGVGGTLVIEGNISVGEFITFNMYLGNLVWPMRAVGMVINTIQRGDASLERIEEVMRVKPRIVDSSMAKDVEHLEGDIKIEDLNFKYKTGTGEVLKNVNLTIKSGETLGVVGRTGSSKTTLISLLLRLYNVEDGKVFIGGRDINKITLHSLRKNIGFVSQDPFLFSDTIADNICLAFDEVDMDKVKEATKMADIYDNIMDFPDKFDTMVGERGTTLSGGQKQRSSIARALIKNPDILILDDCLSAVDAKTEVSILKSLKEFMKNRTSIIVSHRISSVKDADNIIVLDNGSIVEYGTHEELLGINGIYKDIYNKQQIEEEIMSEGGEA